MNDRSIQANFSARDSLNKFDYFVCGVAGAIFAYIVKDYRPLKLEFGISLLEPFALLSLAFSFFAGVKRLEVTNTVNTLNHIMLDSGERAGKLASELRDTEAAQFLNASSGETFDRKTAEREYAQQIQRAEKASAEIQEWKVKGRRWYKLRNASLSLGFLTILCARVLQPYQTVASERVTTTNLARQIVRQSIPRTAEITNKVAPKPLN
jgi:hypothetical protein